jgi:acylphosphatase
MKTLMRCAFVVCLAVALAPACQSADAPAKETMRRSHAFVSGQVQGVGFRAWTREQALNLKLTGWVKNLSDGRVEAVIEGPDGNVAALLKLMERGPKAARVEQVDAKDEPYTGEFKTFDVQN